MPISQRWVAPATGENLARRGPCRVAEFLTPEVLIQLQKGANL